MIQFLFIIIDTVLCVALLVQILKGLPLLNTVCTIILMVVLLIAIAVNVYSLLKDE